MSAEYENQLKRVRLLAQQHLERLQNGNEAFQQSFLFRSGNFVGVRFTKGSAHADWLFADQTLAVFRDGELLTTLQLATQSHSALAA